METQFQKSFQNSRPSTQQSKFSDQQNFSDKLSRFTENQQMNDISGQGYAQRKQIPPKKKLMQDDDQFCKYHKDQKCTYLSINSTEDLLICNACYTRKNPLHYVKILDYFASIEEKVKQMNRNQLFNQDIEQSLQKFQQSPVELIQEMEVIQDKFNQQINLMKKDLLDFAGDRIQHLQKLIKKKNQYLYDDIQSEKEFTLTQEILSTQDFEKELKSLEKMYLKKDTMHQKLGEQFDSIKTQINIMVGQVEKPLDQLKTLILSKFGNQILKNSQNVQQNKSSKLIQYEEYRNQIEKHQGAVLCCSYQKNGEMFATGGKDKKINVHNSNDFSLQYQLDGHFSSVMAIKFYSNDEKMASASEDNTIKLWDLKQKKCVFTIKAHEGIINSISISADETQLVSCSSDQTVKVWNLKTQEIQKIIKDHRDAVTYVQFYPSQNKFISLSDDKCLKIFDSKTFVCLKTMQNQHNTLGTKQKASISLDEKFIAIAGPNKSLSVFKLDANLENLLVFENAHQKSTQVVCFIGNSLQLISSDISGQIKIWNIQIRQQQYLLESHRELVNSIDVSPLQNYIISASNDRSVVVWHIS